MSGILININIILLMETSGFIQNETLSLKQNSVKRVMASLGINWHSKQLHCSLTIDGGKLILEKLFEITSLRKITCNIGNLRNINNFFKKYIILSSRILMRRNRLFRKLIFKSLVVLRQNFVE